MNKAQLKSRAHKLVTKATQLGIVKDGKPLVIDQAYELIAAEDGFRNQHALRASITKSANAKVQVQPVTSEHPSFAWDRLIVSQGWNDRTQIGLFEEFLTENNLMEEFVNFASSSAQPEVDELMPNELIEVLTLMGYSVQNSEFGKPYWEYSNPGSDYDGMCSVDFESEKSAWQDAWLHVQVESDDGAKFAAERAKAGDLEPLNRWIECQKAGLAVKQQASSDEQEAQALETHWGPEHGF